MAQLLLQWMLSMPHFLTLIFKRHVYRLHYIFAIPYTECTANLTIHSDLGLPFWNTTDSQWGVTSAKPHISFQKCTGCVGLFQHGVAIPSRTHSSTHKHTLYLLHLRGILWGRWHFPPDSYHFPSCHELALLVWRAQLSHTFQAVTLICWQMLRGCFWKFSSSSFSYKT